MGEILGYVIVTRKCDGTWAPDWDGVGYPTLEWARAEVEWIEGEGIPDADTNLRIAELRAVEDTP